MEECGECTLACSECQARRLKRKRVCVERGSGRGGGYHSDSCGAVVERLSWLDGGQSQLTPWLSGHGCTTVHPPPPPHPCTQQLFFPSSLHSCNAIYYLYEQPQTVINLEDDEAVAAWGLRKQRTDVWFSGSVTMVQLVQVLWNSRRQFDWEEVRSCMASAIVARWENSLWPTRHTNICTEARACARVQRAA